MTSQKIDRDHSAGLKRTPKFSVPHLVIFSIPIIWGTTFAIVQRALDDVSPMTFVVARFGLVSIVFLVCSRSARMGARMLFIPRTPHERRFRRDMLVLGVTIGMGYILQTVGLLTTTSSKSAFLTSTAVVWTPVLSSLTGRERITLKLGVSVLLTLVGVYFMTQPFDSNGVNIGDALTLGCAIMFGIYIVWIDRAIFRTRAISGSEHELTLMLTSTQLVAATLLLAIFLPAIETPHVAFTPFSIGALIFTALIATGATAYLQARYQHVFSPATAAVIYMLEPVVALAIAELLLGERLDAIEVAGAGLIVLGVIVAQLRIKPRAS
ncbi:MAG TPA: DMT family transporter [Candidatus Kapabacteria bacterium]|jgi:drug/metabolite transporter (DMT)-like permease|nr:DMT family transporter [Candidatus Kapabacteria bacterium]